MFGNRKRKDSTMGTTPRPTSQPVSKFAVCLLLVASVVTCPCGWLSAEEFGGVDFPQGAASFADSVVSYDPDLTGGAPSEAHRHPEHALGAPDYAGVHDGSTSVSLGEGGSITLRFDDNVLTGSASTNLDLWIFEIGPGAEHTFVDISKDGVTWTNLGKVYGSTRGIDLDAYGFGPDDLFHFVKLTDDTADPSNPEPWQGADIDAVGAISTRVLPTLQIFTAVELAWESETNRSYSVEWSTNLNTNVWNDLIGPLQGTGNEMSIFDSIRGSIRKFYRLRED